MRLALCALLALIAPHANAEWVKYGETDFATFYMDPDKIQKEDNIRRVWEFQDLKKRDDSGALSHRFLWEIECKENQYRERAYSAHSEKQLEGTMLVLRYVMGSANAIGGGTNLEVIRNRVCAN